MLHFYRFLEDYKKFTVSFSFSFFSLFLPYCPKYANTWSAAVGIPQVAFPDNQRHRSALLTHGTTYSATEIRIRATEADDKSLSGSPEGSPLRECIGNSRTAGCIILPRERRCRYCAAVHTRHLLPCSRENEMPAGRANAEKESEREGRNDAYKLRSPVRRVFTPFTSAVLPTPQRPPWLIYRRGTRELSLPFSLFLRYRHS